MKRMNFPRRREQRQLEAKQRQAAHDEAHPKKEVKAESPGKTKKLIKKKPLSD